MRRAIAIQLKLSAIITCIIFLISCDFFYGGFDGIRNKGLIDPSDISALQGS